MTLMRADPYQITPLDRPAPLPQDLAAALHPQGQAAHVLLDGTDVPGLAEMVDAAGGTAISLYTGDALEHSADFGPWLVRLDPGHKLTSGMFTRSDAPGHLWGRTRGMFIVSDADTDTLARHFRRFLRMRQPSGAFTLFRFHDGRVLADFLTGCLGTPDRAARFFAKADAPTQPLIDTLLIRRDTGDWAATSKKPCWARPRWT